MSLGVRLKAFSIGPVIQVQAEIEHEKTSLPRRVLYLDKMFVVRDCLVLGQLKQADERCEKVGEVSRIAAANQLLRVAEQFG